MLLSIVKTKMQTVIIGKRKLSPKGGTKGKERRFRATIGTYTEFNDGWAIRGQDGRIHTGTGTVVRFNHRHGTWSVQRPQRCEMNMFGNVFDQKGDPCWLKAERESGFTTIEFRRSFSASFVRLCETGRASAEKKASKVHEDIKARYVA